MEGLIFVNMKLTTLINKQRSVEFWISLHPNNPDGMQPIDPDELMRSEITFKIDRPTYDKLIERGAMDTTAELQLKEIKEYYKRLQNSSIPLSEV